jgi:hypothetical protein
VRTRGRFAAVVVALVAFGALAGPVRAQPAPGSGSDKPRTNWQVELLYDRPWLSGHGVEADGHHLGVWWQRTPAQAGAVLVLRRPVADDYTAEGHAEKITDHPGPILIPSFLDPSDPHGSHPAYDAESDAMPPGTKLGEWTVVAIVDGEPAGTGDPAQPIVDDVPAGHRYIYALLAGTRGDAPETFEVFPGDAIVTWAEAPRAGWFDRRRWFHLVLIGIIAGALAVFTRLAKRRELFVRRLAGVDAIEDAVGRSTEMGRPVLYVTGVEETQDIQTIASLLILGHVAKITAEYDTDLRVANAYPLTMVIAEEVVRQGYANAGRADAHRADNVIFISSEQFAFAAGVNGMILRERPATNIYFGRFYAESLMLAETGYLTGAVQIAGTAELTQLPFFISACDYTLMGEELYACSAYLTREPNQLALLKAGDVMKVVIAVIVVGFTVCATLASQGWAPFTRLSIEDIVP